MSLPSLYSESLNMTAWQHAIIFIILSATGVTFLFGNFIHAFTNWYESSLLLLLAVHCLLMSFGLSRIDISFFILSLNFSVIATLALMLTRSSCSFCFLITMRARISLSSAVRCASLSQALTLHSHPQHCKSSSPSVPQLLCHHATQVRTYVS